MSTGNTSQYILGLDVGATSVGWSIIETDANQAPIRLVDAGCRVFEAGVEGDLTAIESGKDQSKSIQRRMARGIRRNLDRRARRLADLYSILEDAGLLPPVDVNIDNSELAGLSGAGRRKLKRLKRSEARDKVLSGLDTELCGRLDKCSRDAFLKLPFMLRAKALDHKLDKFEIGRAIYHLAQRRGFLSNRKSPDTKEEGEVKKGISELELRITESGSRTLGEYFSRVNPEVEKIRRIWTSRKMHTDEFEAIWTAQQSYYPDILTEDLKKKVHKAIFYQRPLKSQKGKVGFCEHEPRKRRAPIAVLDAQRFRYVQMVNNTKVWCMESGYRVLTEAERTILMNELEYCVEMSFAKAKKLLKLSRTTKFNFEEGTEDKFKGNSTSARLYKIFGERWKEISEDDKNKIVHDVLSIQKSEALQKRGMEIWGLDDDSAVKFAGLKLEDGYLRLSYKAIKKLLPLLKNGFSYSGAVDEIYGFHPDARIFDSLPPVLDMVPELTNPAVIRALSEMRMVVNAATKKYGKPGKIKIELARELKRSREARQKTTREIRQKERIRTEAAEKIKRKTAVTEPKRDDTLKILLADECNWECPYTGKRIAMSTLVGDSPQFDIEHIIPFSRSFDNSYMNKTLCYNEENMHRKRNKTPYEAYHSTSQWDDIIERVRRFKGDAAHIKLERFLLTKTEDLTDFSSRQLNDTRYASKLAAKYLACLYGTEYRKHIEVSTGQITAFVRDALELNSILGDGGEKTRDDHRHHAVDAVAIALIDRSLVKKMADANQRVPFGKHKLMVSVDAPWESFHTDVKTKIDSVVVSHKIENAVNTAMHEESFYSVSPKGNSIRKRIDSLKEGDIANIADPGIRDLVRNKLTELGGGDPAKLFSDPNNAPTIIDSEGEMRKLRTVRIRVKANSFPVGNDVTRRNVMTKSNHHVEIFEITDKKGNPKWIGEMVSQFDAMDRKRKKLPIINRDHESGGKFRFSLFSGSLIEIDEGDGKRGIYRVRSVSRNNVEFVKNNDAKLQKEIKKDKGWTKRSLNELRKLNCQKVIITPLGEVRYAND